uniref:NADH-ubiquinone oxidoreductase chain 2 n=1 Tax=Paedocypris sp. Banka Is. TaxID=643392 RepID=F3Y723_9TELE|nr:NADH dehydrogenase subunit 2 [Paedocypris sp. Banka Is.]
MNPYVLVILLSSLGLGTTITFASSNWLIAWMGLEINTMAILPLMAKHHHPRGVEATTKYFLTQATAAAMILFAGMMNAWITGQWDLNNLQPMTSTLMTAALALKIGLAPVHFWMPEVLQGLSLPTGLIMSTWQKLAPFSLMLQVAPSTNPALLTTLGVLSTLIGGWSGLNQTQLRKILAYSSIAHMGWMIIVIQYTPQLTILTLMIYIILTLTAFMTFNKLNITKLNTMSTAWTKDPALTSLTTLTLLSLGGLPPLTGFMPKWLILQELSNQEMTLTATIIAMSALLSLYFYLRLLYSITLTLHPSTNNHTMLWRTKKQHKLPLTISMVASMSLLPLTPMITTLML